MTWASPKGSPRMSSQPRPLSWIVLSVGLLALFLFFASSVLVSYPIGATVRGYFYGVDSSKKVDLSISPINETTTDVHLDKSLDLVDGKVLPDQQSPMNSTSQSSDSSIKPIDVKSDSEEPLNESTSPKFPKSVEKNGLETSDAGASNAQSPPILSGNNQDVVNTSLPSQFNVPISEPVSALINKSSDISTKSNETSLSPSDSSSSAVPASLEVANNASYNGSVDSGYISCLFA